MSKEEQDAMEDKVLPSGFLAVRFDQLLVILALTIGLVWQIAADRYNSYAPYILCPLMLVLVVFSFVARRSVRRFLKEHGEVSITRTFSPNAAGPRKNVLFREVPDLIDKGIDRLLDGKEKGNP